jgi:hypothetical protein
MQIFPSTAAAIVGGAVVAPLSLAVTLLVEIGFGVRLPHLAWVLVGVVPLIVTATDLRPLRDWRFGPLWIAKANLATMGPQYKRIALYLVSNFISLLILHAIGMKP